MNVGEFKKFLSKFPDDMEIIETRCSDYGLMEIEDWSTKKAVF